VSAQLQTAQEISAALAAAEARLRVSFRDQALSLLAIHRDALYMAAGFKEFLDYCRHRLDIQRSQAYRLLELGEVFEALPQNSPVGEKLTSERQIRDLSKMPTKNKIGILERAVREAESRKTPLTGKLVMEVARRTGWKTRAEYKAEQKRKRESEKPEQTAAGAAEETRKALEAAFAVILSQGHSRAVVELVGDPEGLLGFSYARTFLNDMADSYPLN
jgi:hypothetical protein